MDGERFIDTAGHLVNGTAESHWRSAISRAYYAVFHFGRELCLAHGLDLGPSGNAHSNLYVGLNNCGHIAVHGLASKLDILRTDRTRADYDMRAVVVQSTAKDIVTEAVAWLSDFKVLLQSIPAAQIVAGAKRYLKLNGRIP